MSTPEELAYAESVRSIELQARNLDEVRSRTGVILGAASIVASFLGAEALSASSFGILTGLALLGFAVALGASIAVLWPRGGWGFALGANVLLEDWTGEEACGDMPAMLAFVARRIETNWHANNKRINDMFALFQVAAVGVGAEVLFWTVQLTEGG